MSHDETNSDRVSFGDFIADYKRIVDPLTLPIGCHALDLIGLAAGGKVIDVASGTGALAVEAAHRGLKVLAIDIAPEMVTRAVERLAPYTSGEGRVMSFDALDVADGAFDAAVSIVGVLAFSRGEGGLREMVRVTRAGGQVVVATWDQEQPAALRYLAQDVFARLFPDRQLWPDDFFPAWSRSSLEDALTAAKCEAVEVTVFEGEWLVAQPSDVMDDARLSIGRFPGYAALDASERDRFDRAFTAAVVRHRGGLGNLSRCGEWSFCLMAARMAAEQERR